MVTTLAETIYFGCLRFLVCRLEKPLDQSTSPRWSHSSLRRCLEVILTKTARNTHLMRNPYCRYDLELWLGEKRKCGNIICWVFSLLISETTFYQFSLISVWKKYEEQVGNKLAKLSRCNSQNILASKNQPIVLLEREKRISRLTRGSFTCWHLPSNWTSFSLRESHIHSWERTGSFSKTLLCNYQSLVVELFIKLIPLQWRPSTHKFRHKNLDHVREA